MDVDAPVVSNLDLTHEVVLEPMAPGSLVDLLNLGSLVAHAVKVLVKTICQSEEGGKKAQADAAGASRVRGIVEVRATQVHASVSTRHCRYFIEDALPTGLGQVGYWPVILGTVDTGPKDQMSAQFVVCSRRIVASSYGDRP